MAAAVHAALATERPLLVEGPAGVGKSALARAVAEVRGAELLTVHCHSGMDHQAVLYRWDHARQMVDLRTQRALGTTPDRLHSRRFLVAGPLLTALEAEGPVVLLLEAVDRADDEFEALLLEYLADFAVSIPEIGTVRGTHRPIVVLTSTRVRDVGDALRRRCHFLALERPAFADEVAAVIAAAGDAAGAVGRAVTGAAGAGPLPAGERFAPPGRRTRIDWHRIETVLATEALDERVVLATLGAEDDGGERRTGSVTDLIRHALVRSR